MNELEAKIVKAVRDNLTPDLLRVTKPKKRKDGTIKESQNFIATSSERTSPYAGYCYTASEAIFALLGGYEAGYKIKVADVPEWGYTHYWIVDVNGDIIDATSNQFEELGNYPYARARGAAFRTRSNAATKLIEKVNAVI